MTPERKNKVSHSGHDIYIKSSSKSLDKVLSIATFNQCKVQNTIFTKEKPSFLFPQGLMLNTGGALLTRMLVIIQDVI